MLYETNRHEQLATAQSWSSDYAVEIITKIVNEADSAFDERKFWPSHPEDGHRGESPLTSLIGGAAGTAWSLLTLADQLSFNLKNDYRKYLGAIYNAYQESETDQVPGYFFGKLGYQIVLNRYCQTPETLQIFIDSATEAMDRPEQELMWGAPGGVLAACLLYGSNSGGDPRLLTVIEKGIAKLLNTWDNPEAPLPIWTQILYGKDYQLLGTVHGFAGGVHSLFNSINFMDELQKKALLFKSERTLLATVEIDGVCANWPQAISGMNPNRRLLQWCHGAPGIITSFAKFPSGQSKELDKTLLMAGETIWQAGPLVKPFGICHGNAGNGYALLSLFARTQDEMWLSRARAFAIHAVEQSNKSAISIGRRRYGLLTGDLGLCHFLLGCISQNAALPAIDFL